MNRIGAASLRGLGAGSFAKQLPAGSQTCQKCFKKGHYIFDCPNQRAYLYRPSRSLKAKNPHLRKEFRDQSPEAAPKLKSKITDWDYRRDTKLEELSQLSDIEEQEKLKKEIEKRTTTDNQDKIQGRIEIIGRKIKSIDKRIKSKIDSQNKGNNSHSKKKGKLLDKDGQYESESSGSQSQKSNSSSQQQSSSGSSDSESSSSQSVSSSSSQSQSSQSSSKSSESSQSQSKPSSRSQSSQSLSSQSSQGSLSSDKRLQKHRYENKKQLKDKNQRCNKRMKKHFDENSDKIDLRLNNSQHCDKQRRSDYQHYRLRSRSKQRNR